MTFADRKFGSVLSNQIPFPANLFWISIYLQQISPNQFSLFNAAFDSDMITLIKKLFYIRVLFNRKTPRYPLSVGYIPEYTLVCQLPAYTSVVQKLMYRT